MHPSSADFHDSDAKADDNDDTMMNIINILTKRISLRWHDVKNITKTSEIMHKSK